MSSHPQPIIILGLVAVVLLACGAPQTTAPEIDPAAAQREAQLQKEFALRSYRQDWQRLFDIGGPLLEASAGLCGNHLAPYLGVKFHTVHGFDKDDRIAVAKVYTLDNKPRVSQVVALSPAARAGFLVGDVLLEIQGRSINSGPGASKKISKMLDELLATGRPIGFKIARGPEILMLQALPTQHCNFNLQLSQDHEINAFADGANVVINRGLIRFIESDQHLATIIAHEIAHNAMGHIDAKKTNATVGAIGGLLADMAAAVLGVNTGSTFRNIGARAGASAYSAAFENEADYVGLYILARARYPIKGAADVWRLMATVNPKSISFSGSHPTSPQRYLNMEQYIREITAKLAANAPLVPDGIQAISPLP